MAVHNNNLEYIFSVKGIKRMKSRAAVAFGAGKPLEIVEVDLDGPRAGEVLL
jgi:hypothetical protein